MIMMIIINDDDDVDGGDDDDDERSNTLVYVDERENIRVGLDIHILVSLDTALDT